MTEESYLCATCYKEKYEANEDSFDYVWIELIPCEICTDQPVIWYKKCVNAADVTVK